MRTIASLDETWRDRTHVRRVMLVTDSQIGQRHRYLAVPAGLAQDALAPVVLYVYLIDEDGPCWQPLGFATVEAARTFLEVETGFGPLAWRAIPDQRPGCRDDWIGPVRYVPPRFERHTEDGWVPVELPRTGWLVHLGE